MEITLERVERLREKANVSYTQAKKALEYSGGDLLDALIYLEEQGLIPRPEGACWSTKGEQRGCVPSLDDETVNTETDETQPQESFFEKIRRWLLDNELEIWRKDRPITAMPVLVLLLLVVLATWAAVPLLVVGLFFGFRYRFSGPDLERDNINDAMESVADTASDMGRQVMDELGRQHDRNNKERKSPEDKEE